MDRTVYHVMPIADASRWVVSREDDDSFREEFSSKEEAVQSAKSRARSEEPSQVKVHKKDGDMEYESSYGNDPRHAPN